MARGTPVPSPRIGVGTPVPSLRLQAGPSNLIAPLGSLSLMAGPLVAPNPLVGPVLTLSGPSLPAVEVPVPAAQALPGPTTPREDLTRLEGALQEGDAALPEFFDKTKAQKDGRADIDDESRGASQAGPRETEATNAGDVRQEYGEFLKQLGFREYSSQIGAILKKGTLAKTQKEVLTFNQNRYEVVDSARDLTADVMSGLAEQGFSPEAMERGAELAARLLALQPLDPPASLPPEIAKAGQEKIIAWLSAATVQRVSQQLPSVVSDVVVSMTSPVDLKKYLADYGDSRPDTPETKAFLARVVRAKSQVERMLLTMYTDGELGQTRFAGRALAASLVRHARREGHPELEDLLEKKVKARGLHLENFVGDTLILKDAARPGETLRWKLETGDILGERSLGREAAEITFAVRPSWRQWLSAARQGLTGSFFALWANPKERPKLESGGGWRNRLALTRSFFKKWAAGLGVMRRGYSHVGMASVEEADGVKMLWALDNYPNSGEGGIRKMGVLEQFALNGPYMRFGYARLDAGRTWEAFQKRASQGHNAVAYESDGGSWKSFLSADEHSKLKSIPRSQAQKLVDELNARAAAVMESMMTTLGVAFAYGFSNELWKAYCSATLVLAHRIGGGFEIQASEDRWHPIVMLMKKLGLGDAKNQETGGRIIWPGSFFVDPKVGKHETATHPAFNEVGRLPDPYAMPAYVELDRDVTRRLAALLQHSDEGSIDPDEETVFQAVSTRLDARVEKTRRSKSGGRRSGGEPSTGYSAGLEALLEE